MSFITRFINLFRKQTLEREFDEELRFHIDKCIERNVKRGMTPTDAEVEAYRKFGSPSLAKLHMKEERVMSRSVAIAGAAVVSLCLVTGVWFWMRGSDVPTTHSYYRPTDIGITRPTVVREQKPDYPKEAMDAKIQGTVIMECIVQTDGVCGNIQVARSLDPMWLDPMAVKALEQWRFNPGRLQGEPVPVMVNVEFRFTVRDK